MSCQCRTCGKNPGKTYNLALLKRLLHLLEVGKVADITADALGSSTEGAHGIGNAEVDLFAVSIILTTRGWI